MWVQRTRDETSTEKNSNASNWKTKRRAGKDQIYVYMHQELTQTFNLCSNIHEITNMNQDQRQNKSSDTWDEIIRYFGKENCKKRKIIVLQMEKSSWQERSKSSLSRIF